MRHPQHLGLGHDPRRNLAAAPAFDPLAATLQSRRILHPAWFDRRPALETLQPGDLIALRHHDLLQFRYLAQQFHKPSFQFGTRKVGKIGGRRHATTESYPPASGQARKSTLPRGYAPITKLTDEEWPLLDPQIPPGREGGAADRRRGRQQPAG